MTQAIWHPNKVAWRCRRGLWELDVILQEFFDKNYHNLSSTEKHTFQWLLEQNDPYLQQLLVHQQQDTGLNNEQQKFISKIIQLTNKASKP